MNKERITYLFQSYLNNTATPAELQELESVLNDPANEELLKEIADKSYFNISKDQITDMSDSAAKEKSFNYIIKQSQNKKPAKLWPRIAAAASIVIALSAGGYFLLHKKPVQQTAQIQKQDIAPGSNKAILTLANGKKIVVTGASKGMLAQQANMTISKTAAGQLNYRQTQNASENTQSLMNTLSTQMGGETSLTLADGTEVKLDAASSITYPVAFNGKDRRVSITGQVYFKVKHNIKQPFYVSAGQEAIKDVGTEFNVNAYENVKTTLIEGKVLVNGKPLIPGQQAILLDNQLTVSEGNPEEAGAWANGYFRFNNENIHTIMDKIKRWYNIDVGYDPDVTIEGITGTVSRYKNISQVFYMLSYTGKVHFKIEGRRVTVLR